MSTKKAASPNSAAAEAQTNADRVALTLKIVKADYVRLVKLRLKELEAGRDVTHQDILYDALKAHLHRRGV